MNEALGAGSPVSNKFDYFVIGAGSGGIASARRAAEYGAKVGIAEGWTLGGTCVNRGCVPKKLMVYASRFAQQFREAQGFGWDPVQPGFHWSRLTEAIAQELQRLNGIYRNLLDKSGVTVFPGYAHFLDSHRLEVGGQIIEADRILIAVGGTPLRPNIPGIEGAITSDEIFGLPEQPQRIAILGGGYIAVEFAAILQNLGSEVTLVIRQDRILRGFDGDIRDEIQGALLRQGVNLIANQQITRIERTSQGVHLHFESGETAPLLVNALTFAATGRIPKIEDLRLDRAQVALTQRGAIAVDADQRTSCPHIFAVGDCTDRVNLTPVAIKEGRILADREFGSKPGQMNYEAIPSAIFTTPEAATVGLSEQDARVQYGEDRIQIFRTRFRPMYQTLGGGEDKVMMKLVVHKESDRILGAHMVGEHAAEIIQGVAIAVKMGATKKDFDATVAIHPSAAEEFVTMR